WGIKVELDSVGTLPLGFNRGHWSGKLLAENGMNLHFATPSYTVGTKGVQRGHVLIEPRTEREFSRMKSKLKGAWVLIEGKNRGWPIDWSAKGDAIRDSIKQLNAEIEKKNDEIRSQNWHNRKKKNYKEKELLPMNEEPAIFYKEMVDAGILGIIQASDVPIKAYYDRKNLMRMSFDSLPAIPDIKLDKHQYNKIRQMAEERQYFELEFDIRNHFKMGPLTYHNVIGIIPGTEFPEEYVMMGAHLDAYDVATGGVDDGNGVSAVMEAARLIMKSGIKPKRTILVCLWAGEEFGLLGSESWVKRNNDKMDKISNYFNRDGGPLVATSISVTDSMRADFEIICEGFDTINKDFPFTIEKRNSRELPKEAWGTDSGPFAVQAVPTMSLNLSDHKGYDFSYYEIWHTERDTYDKVIGEYQEHSAIILAATVLGVANLEHLLTREGYYHQPKKQDK
ncbi:MAG: peptidase M28, partial [Marinilabiliales bacterium]